MRMALGGISLALIALGTVVMVGWWIRSEAIVQINPDFTPMQFNTALCFLLGGMGLAALAWRQVWIVRGCAGALALISGLTALQYLTGWPLGIDELFVEHFTTVETSHPGRMAPNTAFAFLLGAAFLACAAPIWQAELSRSLLLVISPAIVGLAVLSLTGYVAGIEALFGWSQYTRMAIHTSLGFLVFGGGAVMVAWDVETQRDRLRSFSLIAPAVAASLTVMAGLWLALDHYERQRLSVLQDVAPELAIRSALPEIVLLAGLLLTALIGVAVHFVHESRDARSLRRANAELREANNELDKFAHVASHDLKSPLRGIRQLASWLRSDIGDSASTRVVRYIDQLDSRAERLQDLLDALLAYSRIGRSRRTLARFGVRAAIEDVVGLAALPSGMDVRIDAGEDDLLADRALFDTVFLNLVTNAAKHHDRDHGVITITVRRTQIVYEIEVADDGPGIPERHHARIFEIFQTLRPRDELEASGMGLAIVGKAANRAGAEIRVISDPATGRGTRFVVEWPRIPPIEE
ncbi:MAG: ATP-binding protein [Pseudomonadota bacterium]|nr:ATP-binding protein [Pseudomonadota bacterium]